MDGLLFISGEELNSGATAASGGLWPDLWGYGKAPSQTPEEIAEEGEIREARARSQLLPPGPDHLHQKARAPTYARCVPTGSPAQPLPLPPGSRGLDRR